MVFLTRIARNQSGPVSRVPEICVEVLSSNRAYDRVTKRFVYAGAGVTEYWIVDTAGFIEKWSGPGLGHEETVTGFLTTSLLPGFGLDVSKLLAEAPGA